MVCVMYVFNIPKAKLSSLKNLKKSVIKPVKPVCQVSQKKKKRFLPTLLFTKKSLFYFSNQK